MRPHAFNASKDLIGSMQLEVNFLSKKKYCFILTHMYHDISHLSHSTTTDAYDTDKMASEFLMQFPGQAFSVGQEIVFNFCDKKMLIISILEILSELPW